MSKTTTLSPEKIELFRQILIHLADLDPKATGQVNIKCPIHGDLTSDSFSANLDDATWTCHGACDTYGGLKELQALLLDVLRTQEPDHCFEYLDETGALLYQICRWDDFPVPGKKEFMTRSTGRAWGLGDVQKVLYRLPEVLAADAVIIVEGEKCADRLADALALRADGEKEVEEGTSIAVTTHPFGANKTAWLPDYSETVRGKAVVILPDYDEAGRQHAQRVAKALHGIAASVRLVELPGLPEKGDIVDWLDVGHPLGELMNLIDETPELTEDDLAAWEDTERTSTVKERKPPSDLEKLAGLAMRYDVFQDADTVARLLQLDTLEQYGLIMLMQQKNSRFDVGRFWRMVEMAAINKTMPPLLTGVEIKTLSETPPPPRVIEKLFLRGGFTIVGADPKCGKSTLIRNAMAAVLEGGEFLGRKCTTGPVLYYAVEGDPAENSKHLCQLLANPDNINHLSMRAGAISPSFFIRTLRQDIQNTGAIFVVIDPLVDILER